MSPSVEAAPVVARGLAVGYRSRAVLSGVDVTVAPGESLALVGSNGSGKSTLLRTLAGLLSPVGGELAVLGGAPGTQPRGLAYLSQFHESGFVLPLRSIDVVRMARFDHRGRFARATALDEDLVRDALQRMGVERLAHRPLRSLSGGQQQRVYLAQVLARRARLLVLDEPTAGLDAAGREAFLAAMQAERDRGAALVTSTHDIGEALVCDRALLLAGRVVAAGPPNEVLTPEHLLQTFGVGLTRIGDRLVITETHHVHHEAGHAPHQH